MSGVPYTLNNKLETHILRKLAVEADCDPRSVAKIVRGEKLNGTLMSRVLPVLQRHGIQFPLPDGVRAPEASKIDEQKG